MRDQNEQNDTQKKEQWSSLYSVCSRDKLSTKLVFLITLMQIKPHLAVEQRHCGIPDHLCLHTRRVCVWLSLVAGRYLSVQRSPFDSSDEENQVPVDFGAVDKLVDVVWIHSLSRLEAGGADAVTRWNTNTHIFLHKHISWFLHTILWKYYKKKPNYQVWLHLPLGQMSVQGIHILMRFSSTSILLVGHALTQELWSTTKLSVK